MGKSNLEKQPDKISTTPNTKKEGMINPNNPHRFKDQTKEMNNLQDKTDSRVVVNMDKVGPSWSTETGNESALQHLAKVTKAAYEWIKSFKEKYPKPDLKQVKQYNNAVDKYNTALKTLRKCGISTDLQSVKPIDIIPTVGKLHIRERGGMNPEEQQIFNTAQQKYNSRFHTPFPLTWETAWQQALQEHSQQQPTTSQQPPVQTLHSTLGQASNLPHHSQADNPSPFLSQGSTTRSHDGNKRRGRAPTEDSGETNSTTKRLRRQVQQIRLDKKLAGESFLDLQLEKNFSHLTAGSAKTLLSKLSQYQQNLDRYIHDVNTPLISGNKKQSETNIHSTLQTYEELVESYVLHQEGLQERMRTANSKSRESETQLKQEQDALENRKIGHEATINSHDELKEQYRAANALTPEIGQYIATEQAELRISIEDIQKTTTKNKIEIESIKAKQAKPREIELNSIREIAKYTHKLDHYRETISSLDPNNETEAIGYKPDNKDDKKVLQRKRTKGAITDARYRWQIKIDQGKDAEEGSYTKIEAENAKIKLEKLNNAEGTDNEAEAIGYKPREKDDTKVLQIERTKHAIINKKSNLRKIIEKGSNAEEGSYTKIEAENAKIKLEKLDEVKGDMDAEAKVIGYKPQEKDDTKALQRKRTKNAIRDARRRWKNAIDQGKDAKEGSSAKTKAEKAKIKLEKLNNAEGTDNEAEAIEYKLSKKDDTKINTDNGS